MVVFCLLSLAAVLRALFSRVQRELGGSVLSARRGTLISMMQVRVHRYRGITLTSLMFSRNDDKYVVAAIKL
jgi:hypothetical protein